LRTYSFSNISFQDLRDCVEIEISKELTQYEKEWFNCKKDISKDDIEFLKHTLSIVEDFISSYKEPQLQMDFIGQILFRVNFYFKNEKHMSQTIRPFAGNSLTYVNKDNQFTFNGIFDFAIAKGDIDPKSPYFFIQEFKKSKEAKDPEPQLLAEMVSAVELNSTDKIRGAFIIGRFWTFVTLHRVGENSYRYYFSKPYDSMDIVQLQTIFSMLLFVKDEIKQILFFVTISNF
jgi:hypothetical protein